MQSQAEGKGKRIRKRLEIRWIIQVRLSREWNLCDDSDKEQKVSFSTPFESFVHLNDPDLSANVSIFTRHREESWGPATLLKSASVQTRGLFTKLFPFHVGYTALYFKFESLRESSCAAGNMQHMLLMSVLRKVHEHMHKCTSGMIECVNSNTISLVFVRVWPPQLSVGDDGAVCILLFSLSLSSGKGHSLILFVTCQLHLLALLSNYKLWPSVGLQHVCLLKTCQLSCSVFSDFPNLARFYLLNLVFFSCRLCSDVSAQITVRTKRSQPENRNVLLLSWLLSTVFQ